MTIVSSYQDSNPKQHLRNNNIVTTIAWATDSSVAAMNVVGACCGSSTFNNAHSWRLQRTPRHTGIMQLPLRSIQDLSGGRPVHRPRCLAAATANSLTASTPQWPSLARSGREQVGWGGPPWVRVTVATNIYIRIAVMMIFLFAMERYTVAMLPYAIVYTYFAMSAHSVVLVMGCTSAQALPFDPATVVQPVGVAVRQTHCLFFTLTLIYIPCSIESCKHSIHRWCVTLMLSGLTAAEVAVAAGNTTRTG